MKINSNIPDAYQKGWVEFYKLKFKVTPDVLIPRPETELLVDAVLERIKYKESGIKGNGIMVLDIGTGSGAIAISVAKNLTSGVRVKIIATDISAKALKIAKQNAKLHRVEDKITFKQSNLLTKISYTLIPKTCTLIIVTNLPYIPTDRIAYLDSSVKDFEPFIALDGGEDGFQLYRKLFSQIIKKGLKPKLIVGEIDYTQGETAIYEGQKYFPEANVEVKKDLAHLQRILNISS
ncbi:MAG: HemK/PrmC family methyltransferase [Microgenomates group bacterium]|jgi:release factor glutamine methyltransferase